MFLSVYKALLAIKEPVKMKESSSPQVAFKIAEVNRCTAGEQRGASYGERSKHCLNGAEGQGSPSEGPVDSGCWWGSGG